MKLYAAAAAAPGGGAADADQDAQEACEGAKERLRLLGMFRQACELAESSPNDCLCICQSLLSEVRHLP
jgi:hypothetical protein